MAVAEPWRSSVQDNPHSSQEQPLLMLATQGCKRSLRTSSLRGHSSVPGLQGTEKGAGMCLPTWFEPIEEFPREWKGPDLL